MKRNFITVTFFLLSTLAFGNVRLPSVLSSNMVLQQKAKITLWGWADPQEKHNAMIYPLTNFSISGVNWYQGESNAIAANTYSRLLTTIINAWRKAWKKSPPFIMYR